MKKCETTDKFNYTEFFDEIESDLTLHAHDIDKKIYQAPNVHNKLLRRFVIERNKLHKYETEYNRVFGELFHHYRYESDIRCENKDVAIFYIKKDKKFLEVNDKYQRQKLLLDTIEKWMKKSERIGFDIKSIIEFQKFMAGN